MRKIALTLAVLGTTLLAGFYTAPAHAQATRTWVSGVGDDANPCSRTAPCKTFAGAISKTVNGGEINCLDTGGFGSVTITKSITLDCHEVFGSVLVAGTNGIVIAAPNSVVTIRNLNFDGLVNSGSSGLAGISIQSAKAVYIEDVMVMNFSQQGIIDNRTASGSMLSVRNTTVRNNTGTAIATFGGGAILENVLLIGNGFGVSAHSGSNVMLSRSVVSESTGDGLDAAAGSQIFADNTEITHNVGNGVNNSGGGNVAFANSDIAFNGTGVTGTTSSYGNNRIFGNTSAGTTPTPIGGVTNDHGQN